ncbi:MAG: ATP-binding protein [Fibrobacterales bacterium]
MYTMQKNEEMLSFIVSSQLENIDRMAEDISQFIAQFGEYNDSVLIQVMRELTLNAIEHGNLGDIDKSVEVIMNILENGRVLLRVKDEGSGFSDDVLPVKRALQEASSRRRGLALVNSLVDELKKGEDTMSVEAFITMQKLFDWGVSETDEKMIIQPNRGVSASVVDELRRLLFKWLDTGVPSCELSLIHTKSFDSVSLSLLISFSKYLNDSEKKDCFSITGVSQDVMMLFRLTQIRRLFKIEELTQEETGVE